MIRGDSPGSVHRNGPFRGRKAVNDASVHGNAGFGG